MTKTPIEKAIEKKFKAINERIRTSFTLIRQDVDVMQNKIEAMRKYLRKKDRQYNYTKKEDGKIRAEFRKNVDKFTQRVTQLRIALDVIRDIQKEVVVKKDLAQIEDRIKTSFKNEIEGYREQIRDLRSELKEAEKRIMALENGKIRRKKSWFGKESD